MNAIHHDLAKRETQSIIIIMDIHGKCYFQRNEIKDLIEYGIRSIPGPTIFPMPTQEYTIHHFGSKIHHFPCLKRCIYARSDGFLLKIRTVD